MMNFPEKVSFGFIDSKTKKPVPNIAISLILYAYRKNDYYIGPKITNEEGLINFERKECVKEIDNSKKFYLMDYASTIEECLPKVGVKIKPRKEIEFAVKNLRSSRDIYEKYWDCSEEYLNALNSTDNDKYIAKTYNFTESDLWQNRILEIELEKT